MTKPSVKAINSIRKKYGIGQNDSLSASQYREALNKQIDKSTSKIKQFSITYELIHIDDCSIALHITGDLLSKNNVDSLSFSNKIRYKNAFKKATEEFYFKEKSRLFKFIPFTKAEISFLFGLKKLRDWDGNQEVIKRVQDTLVCGKNGRIGLGFIIDDNPEILKLSKDGIRQKKIEKNENQFLLIEIKKI